MNPSCRGLSRGTFGIDARRGGTRTHRLDQVVQRRYLIMETLQEACEGGRCLRIRSGAPQQDRADDAGPKRRARITCIEVPSLQARLASLRRVPGGLEYDRHDMHTVDYSKLFDGQDALVAATSAEVMYRHADGIRLRARRPDSQFLHEAIRFSDSAMLLATEWLPVGDELHRQVVGDRDWLHIQFRSRGGGCEKVSSRFLTETPERSCIVSRYPRGSLIEREIPKADQWKYVCLYLTPRGLTELLEVAAADMPRAALWLTPAEELDYRSNVLPLQSAMVLAVNDILACEFQGANRHAYMRAKAVELLTTMIHALDRYLDDVPRSGLALSARDRKKLAHAQAIMAEDLEGHLTLAELARRVGLNRTKLALGFKNVYGVSVQEYWRDARLVRANELLRDGAASITDVAFSMGYAELSSFTRAFHRKFGLLPRDCRKKAVERSVSRG